MLVSKWDKMRRDADHAQVEECVAIEDQGYNTRSSSKPSKDLSSPSQQIEPEDQLPSSKNSASALLKPRRRDSTGTQVQIQDRRVSAAETHSSSSTSHTRQPHQDASEKLSGLLAEMKSDITAVGEVGHLGALRLPIWADTAEGLNLLCALVLDYPPLNNPQPVQLVDTDTAADGEAVQALLQKLDMAMSKVRKAHDKRASREVLSMFKMDSAADEVFCNSNWLLQYAAFRQRGGISGRRARGTE